jgi:Na+-exporting ATPase
MGASNDGQPSGGHVSGQSNKPTSRPAHALTYEQLATELNADVLSGLTANEAKTRLEQFGRNDLGEEEGVQPLKIVVAQIANAMTLVTVPISSTRERWRF